MKPILLTDIINNIGAKCDYSGGLVISGVSTDTRTIKKGDLFIALVGEKFDGHHYINTAIQNGASAVIISQPIDCEVPALVVDDTLLALHRLAAYYKSTLDIKVVAVTGSNGKTTTRDMIACVLSSKYKVYSTAKNFNNEIGLPKSVLELDDSYDIAVLEMGMNHFGEIRRLTNIAKPDVAVITNIGMAHIGNLGSQENILKAKLEILEGLSQDGLLILNGDDPYLRTAETGAFHKELIGINSEEALTLRAENIVTCGGQTEYTVNFKGGFTKGFIPVLGNYNVLNSMEAICVGMHFGIDAEEAFQALSGYQSVGMRCEAEEVNGVIIVKDYYNASPDSARVALETLGAYAKGGKKIALLGEMLELGEYSEKEHYNLGAECVKNKIDYAFFLGDDYKAFKEGMPDYSFVFPKESRADYILAVSEFVRAGNIATGDAVLVKGSRGMKMEEVCEALISELS